jgi:hypothetical protein
MKLSYWTAAAALAGATLMSVASTNAAPADMRAGLTQDLSARTCRTVVTHRWRHGRRIAVRKSVCSPGYVRPAYRAHSSCRTVVKYRWSNGRRVTVRTRVC